MNRAPKQANLVCPNTITKQNLLQLRQSKLDEVPQRKTQRAASSSTQTHSTRTRTEHLDQNQAKGTSM